MSGVQERTHLRGAPQAQEEAQQETPQGKSRRKPAYLFLNAGEARRQIGNIIQEFYEGKARFEDYRGRIEELVELIYNNDFRDYLDQLIRMRVNVSPAPLSTSKRPSGSTPRAYSRKTTFRRATTTSSTRRWSTRSSRPSWRSRNRARRSRRSSTST